MNDGRIAYIDFGMMDQLDEVTKETLVDAIVHLVNKDYTDLAEDFCEAGVSDSRNRYSPDCTCLRSRAGKCN